MNVKVDKSELNVVTLEIEVDAATFEKGMQKAFLRNAKNFNIPGFRKGKAPRNIVERTYGEQVLYEDAINEVFPDAYDEAVAENDIHPVERPEIDIKQIGNGQNLIFTAKVTVKPEVELGEYKGISINKIEAQVSDEDIQSELERIADRNSRIVTIEDRPVQSGDITVIDFEGFIDGVAFEGGKAEDHELVIGSGQFIPGFEEQLIGVSAGADIEVNLSFPEEYHVKDLAGKPALFKVKIKEIKVKELPAIDDEFAKDVSEFDTLEEYKSDLKEKLLDNARHKAMHDTEDAVVKKAVENATVEIPEVMVENRVDSIVQDFDHRLRYQGLDLNQYLELTGMPMEAFRGQFQSRAKDDVKTQLVIEKISKAENIQASEEDLDEEIKKFAESSQQTEEEFKKHLREEDIEYIKGNIVVKNTIDFLVENAVIV